MAVKRFFILLYNCGEPFPLLGISTLEDPRKFINGPIKKCTERCVSLVITSKFTTQLSKYNLTFIGLKYEALTRRRKE